MDQFTPSTTEHGSLEFTPAALQHLNETRKWTLFLSILGFVFIGLMIIGFILLVVINPEDAFPKQGVFALVPMLFVAVLYFFPIYYLLKFSFYTKRAIVAMDNMLLAKAMQYLKMEFRFMGILAIIIMGLYMVALISMLVTRAFI